MVTGEGGGLDGGIIVIGEGGATLGRRAGRFATTDGVGLAVSLPNT